MELQKKKHPRELGNGHHEAESTAHCLLKVSSCEPGNRAHIAVPIILYYILEGHLSQRT